jgi:hypothetical protein
MKIAITMARPASAGDSVMPCHPPEEGILGRVGRRPHRPPAEDCGLISLQYRFRTRGHGYVNMRQWPVQPSSSHVWLSFYYVRAHESSLNAQYRQQIPTRGYQNCTPALIFRQQLGRRQSMKERFRPRNSPSNTGTANERCSISCSPVRFALHVVESELYLVPAEAEYGYIVII